MRRLPRPVARFRYREFAANWACNAAGTGMISSTADQTRAQCKALCNAAGACRAYETTVDTHTHIDADNGVEHIAGDCKMYMAVNNYEEETTVAGNRQCYAKIDAASVGIGSYERSQANDWRFVDGANTYFLYKDGTGIGARWKVTASQSATADQVYYWGPDASSAEAVDGPPPAARWTTGEAAAGAVPPSLITCAIGQASCSGGTYRFMKKAFQLGSTYEVPVAYALQQFTIPGGTIADGACTTVANSAGGNDQRLAENGGILNQYKCCDGQIFGQISTDGAGGTTDADLCANDVGDMATQCSVFGANMYDTSTSDPSIGCTGNTHFSALTNACAPNVCHCKAHGTAVANAQCTSHGLEQCATCDTGYHNEYTTAQGDAFDVFEKDYATVPCIRNSCKCTNGTPFVGATAATEGCADDGFTNKCASCSADYALSGTLQCDLNECICAADYPTTLFPSGGEVVGIPATGGACPTPGAQVCTTCNTGFDFDEATKQCNPQVSHCADSENQCNQVRDAGNTCSTTTGTDPRVTCACTGNYGLYSNCHKCNPGFAGADCSITCTNMRDSDTSNCGTYKCGTTEQQDRCTTESLGCTPSRSWVYTPILDTDSTNDGDHGNMGCSFACGWNFFYQGAGNDICNLNKPCEAATWVAPLNGGLGTCGAGLAIAHPDNLSSPQDVPVSGTDPDTNLPWSKVTLPRDYFGIPSDTACAPTCDAGYGLNRTVAVEGGRIPGYACGKPDPHTPAPVTGSAASSCGENAMDGMCWNGGREARSVYDARRTTHGARTAHAHPPPRGDIHELTRPTCPFHAPLPSPPPPTPPPPSPVLEMPTCDPLPCKSVIAPDNGSLGACVLSPSWFDGESALESHTSCQPACDAGYTASGEYSCLLEVLTVSTCMPNPCEAPTAPDNGAVGTCTLALTSGGACQPTCDAGYTVSGTSSCFAGTTTLATCEPNPCEGLQAPANGAVGTCTTTLASGGACTPTCDAGFMKQGADDTTCLLGAATPAICVLSV
jgi:hypothetical protein